MYMRFPWNRTWSSTCHGRFKLTYQTFKLKHSNLTSNSFVPHPPLLDWPPMIPEFVAEGLTSPTTSLALVALPPLQPHSTSRLATYVGSTTSRRPIPAQPFIETQAPPLQRRRTALWPSSRPSCPGNCVSVIGWDSSAQVYSQPSRLWHRRYAFAGDFIDGS